MDIFIFGYKVSVEILILIGIIYLILAGHTFCSCCNINGYGFMEGLANMATTHDASNNSTKTLLKADAIQAVNTQNKPLKTQTAPGNNATPIIDAVKVKAVGTKEGFTGANINFGQSSSYNLNGDQPTNTSNWFQPNLSVVSGQSLSQGVQDFLSRPKQPVPLPEGEMLMFANTEFKPECCPNTYSTSTGCACMTGQQYNYLVLRGSNNVPYSEY
jgi:hypothetical protein